MEQFHIHPQLLADCHQLGKLSASDLLLHRNAALPWFILVPDTQMSDVLDLPQDHRDAVLAECAVVSAFIKSVLGYNKVNFAGLGNVVPQMHLHIIGGTVLTPVGHSRCGAILPTATCMIRCRSVNGRRD